MLNKVFSSGEAFLGWKQSEDAPHMPVSSCLSAMTIVIHSVHNVGRYSIATVMVN